MSQCCKKCDDDSGEILEEGFVEERMDVEMKRLMPYDVGEKNLRVAMPKGKRFSKGNGHIDEKV